MDYILSFEDHLGSFFYNALLSILNLGLEFRPFKRWRFYLQSSGLKTQFGNTKVPFTHNGDDQEIAPSKSKRDQSNEKTAQTLTIGAIFQI